MEQLIAHLIGDYWLQNHWMANEKTKRMWPALLHALLYGLPFLLLVTSWQQWVVIVVTHAYIDRYRLITYWLDFWGVGKAGWLPTQIEKIYGVVFGGDHPNGKYIGPDDKEWTGECGGDSVLPKAAPPFLGVWLLIIADNTLHLLINYSALTWL